MRITPPLYLLPFRDDIVLPFARCDQAAWGTAQTPAHDPSLSDAPALPSWPAPPPTPYGKFQSAERRM